MARKKRLTRKKKSKSKQKSSQETRTPGGLSAREFATLPHEYGSFHIEDTNHEQVVFATEDIAYIRYQDLEDDAVVPEKDYWIGKILEIRGNDSADVWVRVEWFWAPQEVAEVIKSFDPTICGEYEKLSSDNTDIISVHCFVDHVNVTTFDETDIYQEPIEDEDWFTRYNFLYTAKRISPKVTHPACTICKVPYTPGEDSIQHFCPRPGCRKFYHQSCLLKNGYYEKIRSRPLLETWPELDRTVSVQEFCGMDPPKKRQKLNHSTSKSENDPLRGFPARLIAVANQQILRGTPGGGIVGNIASVVAARQYIHRTLTKGDIIPDDWENTIDTSTLSEPSSHPCTVCPSCLSPI